MTSRAWKSRDRTVSSYDTDAIIQSQSSSTKQDLHMDYSTDSIFFGHVHRSLFQRFTSLFYDTPIHTHISFGAPLVSWVSSRRCTNHSMKSTIPMHEFRTGLSRESPSRKKRHSLERSSGHTSSIKSILQFSSISTSLPGALPIINTIHGYS